MLALHRTLSTRYIRQRWSRSLLVIASIALGVATLVATRSLSQCMAVAVRGAATPLAGVADLMVSNGENGVRRDLIEPLRQARIPGVADIQPLIIGRVLLPELNGQTAVVLGVDLGAGQLGDNPWGVEAKITHPLAWLSGRKPALIGSELAKAFPQGIGTIRVLAAGKEMKLAGAGTVDAHGPAASLGGSVLVMRLADAASVLGRPDLVTRIDLKVAPGAEREQVQEQVARFLAGRADVRPPEANDRAVHDVMAGVQLGFMLGGVGALVVGLFLVYNALSVTVTERRHDIGILRSMGATRGQVAGLFAAEAVLLGLAGSVLGVPLGFGLAHFATGPIKTVVSDIFLPVDAGQLSITIDTVLAAIAAGVCTALLAALVPALRAANQEPADAVRRVPVGSGLAWRVLQAAFSASLVLGGLASMALRERLAPRLGSFGGIILVLLGILFATPLLAWAVAALLAPVARRVLRIEGRLAADNLARSPGRTGLVIAALAAGVALLVETAGLTVSSEREILDWIDESISADLFITCNSPIAAGGQSQPMGDQVGREIAGLPEVEAALPVRFQRLDFRDTIVFLIALDAAGFHRMGSTRPPVQGHDLYPALRQPGTALVSENFAVLHRVSIGDVLSLRGPHGPVPLKVIGTVLDYSWNRGTVLVDREQYRKLFDDNLVDAYDVYLRPAADVATVRETISRRWGAEQSLVVMTRGELRQVIIDMIRRLYSLAYAQELVVGLVAALGVVTALLISVLQRRRELGLLRAVGASRGQVLRSVLAEAILMGLVGSAIGLLVGIPLEWYAVRVILLEETGYSFAVHVPWQAIGLVITLALGTATLAGLGPAIHAMRLRIPEAIAYE